METESDEQLLECPVCNKQFEKDSIETHVNRCIFLNATEENAVKTNENKRTFSVFNTNRSPSTDSTKKSRKSGAGVPAKPKPGTILQKQSSSNVIQLSDDEDINANVSKQ